MPQHDAPLNEEAPLLTGGRGATDSLLVSHQRSPEAKSEPKEVYIRRRLVTIGLCVTLIFTLEIGVALANTALMQVQENILCDRLNPLAPGNDGREIPRDHVIRCSDNKVQNELSIIQSWNFVLELLPGLVMAVPFGLIADRYGRVVVLGLSMTGMTLQWFYIALVCEYSL
jgi:MFS family permease